MNPMIHLPSAAVWVRLTIIAIPTTSAREFEKHLGIQKS